MDGNAEGAMSALAIRQLRTKLGWTQLRMGLVISVHRSTISRWECARQIPSVRHQQNLRTLSASSLALPSRIKKAATRKATSARASERDEIMARLNGRKVIASISGGKDSAAMSLYLHELGIDHERVFLDTGWEHPATYDYLRGELPRVLGPITWIRGPMQMEELIHHKGMFPSRLIRFCTQQLKVIPMVKHLRSIMDAGLDVVNTVGIRAAESIARSKLTQWEWQDSFDCEVWRPLLHWTEADVIAIHKRHGLRPNPLYLLGASRVGCWPCIFARKSEIRLVAETDPGRIVRLKVLETEVAAAAQQRAERDGRQLKNLPTWYQNPTSSRTADGRHDGACWPIERVVEWSRSAPRGSLRSKDEFLFAAHLDGCMRWGLCDTGAAEQGGQS